VNTTVPAVSVVVPCRNEKRYIRQFVDSMLSQEPPPGGFELIIADGRSTDGTREMLTQMSAVNSLIRVIDNPGRIVSTGLNGAILVARGDIIIRADVHTEYAPDYICQCVTALTNTGAVNVGGPWVACGRGYLDGAIAAAFHSRFGSGGALAHDPDYEGVVDTVYLGCWRREYLRAIGGFDEQLVRNQDDELNLRSRRAGDVVWQTPRIQSRYYPRASLMRLFTQYMQYGYWKVLVIRKHRLPASWRHLMPAAFVSALTVLAVSSLLWRSATVAFYAVIIAYGACAVMASAVTAARSELRFLPVLPVVFSCFHIGYGYGFLRGAIDFLVLRRAPTSHMSALTRS